MLFQVGIRLVNFQLDLIQNSRLSDITNFYMPDICQIVQIISMKQNVRLHVVICPEKCQLHQIQNGAHFLLYFA